MLSAAYLGVSCKKMKFAISVVAALVVGLASGAFAVVKLFGVEPDFLGAPYENRTVVVSEPLVLEQSGVRFTVPAGTTVVHRYNSKEVAYYSLNFVAEAHQLKVAPSSPSENYLFVEGSWGK